MTPTRQDHVVTLLERLPDPADRHLLTLLDTLHASKFTGAITLHWYNGEPRFMDLGQPIRLPIVPTT